MITNLVEGSIWIFQFQSGTIKGWNCQRLNLIKRYFNSNLVRLKGWKRRLFWSASSHFNSNLVRLKAKYPTLTRGHQPYFNSNLVRLKATNAEWPNTPELFQFQSGTIKGWGMSVGSKHKFNFNSNLVRLKGLRTNAKARIRKISIPIWYD